MKKKIVGFWHLLLINHYEEVIREQLNCILDSGLYDAVENIYIGALGENKEFAILIDILRKYPKFIISEYSRSIDLFEFHTLHLLKEFADTETESYYLFYFHSKGISFSKKQNEVAYHGGGRWRKFMNQYTLTKWRDNVEQLDFGYETCGTQLRPNREWKEHYSGNFFWAKSEYVKLLKPIYSLNLKDRFQAEFYICSAHPIAATLSQEFYDYYSPKQPEYIFTKGESTLVLKEGEFKHEEKNRKRNIVGTLCWATYPDIERAVKSLYELNDPKDFIHIIADLSFPLEKIDEVPKDTDEAIKNNSKKLKALAEKYGSKYVKMQNNGVSGNWSVIAKEEKIGEGDVLITCDPDEVVHPKAYNWVRQMGQIIRSPEKYGAVALMMEEQFNEVNNKNSEERIIDGIRVIDVKGALMWATCAFNGTLVKQMGCIPNPSTHKIYGGLETAMMEQMNKFGYKWCFLPDCLVHHPIDNSNEIVREWKNYILNEAKENGKQSTLEEFLQMKKEGKL